MTVGRRRKGYNSRHQLGTTAQFRPVRLPCQFRPSHYQLWQLPGLHPKWFHHQQFASAFCGEVSSEEVGGYVLYGAITSTIGCS